MTNTFRSRPAILGGDPLVAGHLNIVAPQLPPLEQISGQLAEMLASGQLTNHARYVPELEQALVLRLGVERAVTVANATLGLVLALEALCLEGEVILPSFTFSASAHALYWARLQPVFVDILPDTFTLDPAAVEAAIRPRTAAILGVHIYGHPCEVDELQAVADRHDLPLFFDAAHAIGSCYKGRPVGRFGVAEVFSFHATKVFPVGEGGCIATNDAGLADHLALARKFGDPGDEDTRFPGMNAKMQEFNALLGLAGLETLDRHIANRRGYAGALVERLSAVPGISFQTIRPYAFMNYQNFAILIDEGEFGISRDELHQALLAENIHTRRYFYPPLHWHQSYAGYRNIALPVTERVSDRVLCLPFYSEMSDEMIDVLCAAVERIHRCAPQIRQINGNSRKHSLKKQVLLHK